MNSIDAIKFNTAGVNNRQRTAAPSFRGAVYTPAQNQTQVCSSEANKAIADQIHVLVKMNAGERFLDKSFTVPQVHKKLAALYEISDYIKENPYLNAADMSFEDLSDSYFEGLKYGNNADFNVQKQKEFLKKLSAIGENPSSRELFKKIAPEVISDIVVAQTDVVNTFDARTFETYNNIFNNKIYKPFTTKMSPARVVSNLIRGEDTVTINKNLSLMKKLLKKKEYSFLSKESVLDFNLFKYKGDLREFFDVLKNYNDKLHKNEKLSFFVDTETNEVVISITDKIDKNFIIRKRDILDTKMNKLSSDSTVFSRNKDNILVQTTKVEDYKNNTSYQIRQLCDDGNKTELFDKNTRRWLLDKQVKEVKDAKGKIISREIIMESGIDGAFNIKTLDAEGRIHTKATAYKNPDGSVYIEKNMKSPDGILTRVRYKNRMTKDGVQTAEIMDYSIYDSNGKQIAKRENILQRINNLCNETIKDGEKHKIYINKNSIKVVNEKSGKVSLINLETLIRNNDKELTEFFKNLSGSTLETINDTVSSVVKTSPMDSYCIPETRYLEVGADNFILHHELGHIKSFTRGNVSTDSGSILSNTLLNGNKGRLSTDPELVKIFTEEQNRFNSSFPRRIREFAQYFTDRVHIKEFGGLEEAFSDIEALLNNVKVPKEVMKRVHFLQENYPKTIAYIIKRKF